MKIDGGCHCGYITYEAEIDADKTLICHRTDCQTLSGSAFARGHVHARRCFQVTFRQIENVRQDQRKREQTATIVLPGMWNTNLCDD